MYGKYKHSVDPKGRLFVPSKLRDELGGRSTSRWAWTTASPSIRSRLAGDSR